MSEPSEMTKAAIDNMMAEKRELTALRQRIAVLEKALRWYEERAKAIGHIDKGKDYQAAVYTELTLDSGTRARKALADGE